MQALQASGQAAEVRDPFPVRGPETGEAANSEHPFMKLLASLRNAMRQGSEKDLETLDSGSGSKSASLSKGKLPSVSSGSTGNGIEGAEGGLRQDSGLAAMKASSTMLQTAGQQTQQGAHGQDLAAAKEKSLSSALGDKAATIQRGIALASAAKAGQDSQNPSPGRGRGSGLDGVDIQGRLQLDQEKLAGMGGRKSSAGPGRDTDGISEVLARHKRQGSGAGSDGTLIAASGNLNGAFGLSSANRNLNHGGIHSKNDSAASVDESKTSGRRPSRYSVVDMRLKDQASKASPDTQSEGKSAGKQSGSESVDWNRGGLSGTDAAGRQIGTEQPASGFGEAAKGSGAENNDKAPASFAENLAARLRDGGSMDIVRSAQIVLKDGDAGLIRLRLDPESLGGVKIELKLADKQISARIIVESDLAGEAFRSSLDSLRDAFASSGFETTSIEVEVRDGRAGAGDAGRDRSGDDEDGKDNELYMARKARELGDAVPAADAAYGRYGVIDLVV